MIDRPWPKWAAPALLAVIVILFYWKLTLTSQYSWMESPDLAYQVLPWFQFQAVEWHHSRFPLWDPNGYAGQTLFGQGQPGAAYPLNWLLFLTPFRAGFLREGALDWYFVLTRWLAAINCYALCRALGRSRIASMLGGCVFALGGYVAAMTWPQKVNGAVWAPLALLFLLRAVQEERRGWANAALSGFFLGVTWLGGHHEAAAFLTLACIAMWLWSRRWRLAVGSLAVAALTSGLQTVPMLEYGARAVRWVGAPNDPLAASQTAPYTVHAQFSLKPFELLGVILPRIDDEPTSPFAGLIALGLAVAGVALAWREKSVRWLMALALGGILFALGASSLLHGVLYAVVPMLDKARSPNAATLLFALGVAPLAAFGLDKLGEIAGRAWLRRIARAWGWIGALLAAASLGFYLTRYDPPIPVSGLMTGALCALLASAVFSGARSGGLAYRAAGAAALALALFELYNAGADRFPHKSDPARSVYLKRLGGHTDIAMFLRGASNGARIEYDDQAVPENFGDWFGLDTFTSYAASVPANIWRLNLFDARGKDFFGIRYSLAKAATREGQREVFQGSSGVKVFENPPAYPRAWTVHEAIALPHGATARDTLDSAQFDPRRTAFTEGEPPRLETCDAAGDSVAMPVHVGSRVRITAHLECRGMVILTDAWFPGWRATVDGGSAPVYEIDGAVRGVAVDAGDHVVEMRYLPWSVMLGAAMTLAGLAMATWARWSHR